MRALPPQHHGAATHDHFHRSPHRSLPAAASSSHHRHLALVLAFAVGGGLALLVLLAIALFTLYYRFKSSKTNPFDPAAAAATLHRLQKFSYRELKKATASFSAENKLGQGGFGPVHKGVLRNGQIVAVKSLDSASLQGEKEFQNEVSVIGTVRSSHIVGLIGYCAERKKRLLVYEYMANRSLQEALFHDGYPVELDWKMRYKMVADIAQALAFLHFRCEPGIIHGDIKPSNVLLDDSFCARVADFGLARAKTEPAAEAPPDGTGGDADDHDRVKLDRFVRDNSSNNNNNNEKWIHSRKKKMRKDALSRRRLSSSSSAGIDDKQQQQQQQQQQQSQQQSRQRQHDDRFQVDHEEVVGVMTKAMVVDQTVEPGTGEVKVADGFSFHNEAAADTAAPPSSPLPDGSCWKVESRRSVEVDMHMDRHDQLDGGAANQVVGESNVGERRRSRGEWWWNQQPQQPQQQQQQQDCSGIVKDYTVDWLSCQVKSGRSRSRDWGDAAAAAAGNAAGGNVSSSSQGKRSGSVRECSRRSVPGLKSFQISVLGKFFPFKYQRWKLKKKQQQQYRSRELSGNLTKSREWWREEYLEDLCNKSRELNKVRKSSSCSFDFSGDLSAKYQHQPVGGGGGGREWWSGDLLHWIHRSRGDSMADLSGELSLSRELRCSRERTLSRERWSGELGSRAVSSTTSMRGTVCYAAPENGGGGMVSDKSDVYSFGVLVLVIVSGRRPLQVVSPSVEFERASLTSWARHLVQGGDVLELVDPALRGEFSREQAVLCIMVALQCIQRLPGSRPSMAEVVRVLSGESQLPPLELFSPSPQKSDR